MEEQQNTEIKEEEKKPKKGIKRTLGIVLLVLIVCGVAYFAYDALKYQQLFLLPQKLAAM